jgi:hypothetical protein
MKTIFIYEETGKRVRFFERMGDYSYLDRIYINGTKHKIFEDELKKILKSAKFSDKFPSDFKNVKVVCVGIHCLTWDT